jgi:large subunit ribosomal protein L22
MNVTANLYHFHSSSQKIRLATQFVRGLPVAKAQAQLQFSPRAGAKPVLKLLNSAIANAEHNHKLSADTLFIKELTINEGATLKRFRPRAFGRAGTIRKRTSHIKIVLSDQNKTKKVNSKLKKAIEPSGVKAPKSVVKEVVTKKPASKSSDQSPVKV